MTNRAADCATKIQRGDRRVEVSTGAWLGSFAVWEIPGTMGNGSSCCPHRKKVSKFSIRIFFSFLVSVLLNCSFILVLSFFIFITKHIIELSFKSRRANIYLKTRETIKNNILCNEDSCNVKRCQLLFTIDKVVVRFWRVREWIDICWHFGVCEVYACLYILCENIRQRWYSE